MTEKKMLNNYPELISEWDWVKNQKLNVDELSCGSNKIAWWICQKGHSYDSKISTRFKTKGCPYCSNQRILAGYNDFESQQSDLMKFWNFSKNTVSPKEISPRSGKKVWWICERGHEYQSSPHLVSTGRKCLYCSNKKVLTGFNDILTVNPLLLNRWSDRNSLPITEYLAGSNKKVWWICKKEHEFEAPIRNMVKNPDICAICSGKKALSGFNDLSTIRPELLEFWDFKKNKYLPSEVTIGKSSDKTYFICKNKHSFSMTLADINQGKWCLQCSIDSYVSKPEKEIYEFLKSLFNVNIEQSSRSIISPYELDIYLPDFQIAIEFNGLFWHNEKYMKMTNKKNIQYYHFNKWNMCRKQGIQLITVWEDDWRDNRDVVKSMIAHKLNFSSNAKIYARKTVVEKISASAAKTFLNSYHIQGFKNGCANIALKSLDGEIVAVSQLSFNKGECSIERYATSCNVPGGFTKIVKYIEKTYSEIGSISTFSDNEVSDGGLYSNNGFEVDYFVRPDYKYIYENKRFHKFNFRKIRFEKDPELLFEKDLTENQLADLNNIPRIWDSGKTKYIKKLNRE